MNNSFVHDRIPLLTKPRGGAGGTPGALRGEPSRHSALAPHAHAGCADADAQRLHEPLSLCSLGHTRGRAFEGVAAGGTGSPHVAECTTEAHVRGDVCGAEWRSGGTLTEYAEMGESGLQQCMDDVLQKRSAQ